MWTLFASAYTGATRDAFQRDLAEKHHAIVLKDDRGALQGFSTLLRLEVKGACVVFSGDTIVAKGLRRVRQWYRSTGSMSQAGIG